MGFRVPGVDCISRWWRVPCKSSPEFGFSSTRDASAHRDTAMGCRLARKISTRMSFFTVEVESRWSPVAESWPTVPRVSFRRGWPALAQECQVCVNVVPLWVCAVSQLNPSAGGGSLACAVELSLASGPWRHLVTGPWPCGVHLAIDCSCDYRSDWARVAVT